MFLKYLRDLGFDMKKSMSQRELWAYKIWRIQFWCDVCENLRNDVLISIETFAEQNFYETKVRWSTMPSLHSTRLRENLPKLNIYEIIWIELYTSLIFEHWS